MQYQQINLNDFNGLMRSDLSETENVGISMIDLNDVERRAHAARATATLQGIAGIRKAVLRLFA
jgi:hypothetical protein